MLILLNFLWTMAAFALFHWSKRFKGTGCGPYMKCTHCRLWYQACEVECPTCCVNGHAAKRSTTILPWTNSLDENNLAYDNVLTENNRVNASKRNAKILRYLAIARFFVVMGFFGITGLCLQNNCVGFDAYNGSNVNHRYDVYVTLIGWFLYEITSSFYLLGDGSATRQGPGALASPIAQRFASPFYDSMEWVLRGRRHATVAAMCVYAAAGVANLAIVTIWLYLGIYPSHPVTGSVGESDVALHILMPTAGMYAMNIMTLFVESHVGFMVEEPQLNVPEGGWRASSTPPMLR